MNKSIVVKLTMLVLIIALFSSIFCYSSSYAMGEIISGGKDFLSASTVINTTQLHTTSNYIYNTLLAVAIVVAVIVAMVLGIQFMVASADEKAKVKEALMPFVVGCIVVFGSFTIWKVAVNIGNKTEGAIKESSLSLEEQAKYNHDQYGRIENGEIAEFSDQEVIDAYKTNKVSDDLAAWTKEEADPRSGGLAVKGVDYGLTLDQAIKKLTDYKRIIYNEAKNRGLLAENGIYLKK